MKHNSSTFTLHGSLSGKNSFTARKGDGSSTQTIVVFKPTQEFFFGKAYFSQTYGYNSFPAD